METEEQGLPLIYLARHGETTWSITGQHTGMTDLPLTDRGKRNASRLGSRLQGVSFSQVYTSPSQRAMHTCELAGFKADAKRDADLTEWDYGDYEGKTTTEIRRLRPGWEVFRDGCPGGETVAEVALRADRVVDRLRGSRGSVLLFSSGHFLRVLVTRWLSLEPAAGRFFMLGTASLSVIGYYRSIHEPVIHRWNDCSQQGD